MATLAVARLWIADIDNAANDRYIVASFTNGTSQQVGGVNPTLDFMVFDYFCRATL